MTDPVDRFVPKAKPEKKKKIVNIKTKRTFNLRILRNAATPGIDMIFRTSSRWALARLMEEPTHTRPPAASTRLGI